MKQQQTKISSEQNAENSERICTLINSIFYFVGNVTITDNNGIYRLLAKHNGRTLIDKDFRTLRGAKIAFSKLFGCRSWRDDVKAEWSTFYIKDKDWVQKGSDKTN